MLNEMKCVYAVYQERSFSKAAKKLFVSQPALSNMIKRVENKLGVPIFDRSTIPLTVTKEGEYYIRSIEQIMFVQRNVDSYFRDLDTLKTGALRLGGSSYFCSFLFPSLIGKFHHKYPDVTIELLEGNVAELKKGLAQEDLDLVLETGIQPEDPNVDNFFYRNEHLILAVPASFAINDELKAYQLDPKDIMSKDFLGDCFPSVPLNAFRACPFATMKPGNDMYTRGLEICRNAGFSMNITMMFDQILTAMNVIEKSAIGAFFVRSDIVSYMSASRRIIYYKLDDPLTVRPISFAAKKGRYLSKAVRAFIDIARDELHESGENPPVR